MKPDKTIYKMVYYDSARTGFFYQLTKESQEQGPFGIRESAVADASWQMRKDFSYVRSKPGSEAA